MLKIKKNVYKKFVLLIVIHLYIFSLLGQSFAGNEDDEFVVSSSGNVSCRDSCISGASVSRMRKILLGAAAVGAVGCVVGALTGLYGPFSCSEDSSLVGGGGLEATTGSLVEAATTHLVNAASKLWQKALPNCPPNMQCCYEEAFYNQANPTPAYVIGLNETGHTKTLVCEPNLVATTAAQNLVTVAVTAAQNMTTAAAVTMSSAAHCVQAGAAAAGAFIGAAVGAAVGAATGAVAAVSSSKSTTSDEDLEAQDPPLSRRYSRCHTNEGFEEGEDDEETQLEEALAVSLSTFCVNEGFESNEEDKEASNAEKKDDDTSDGNDQRGSGGHSSGFLQAAVVHSPYELSLIQHYNRESQLSSLQCMQGILLETSEQLITNLKILAMKTSEKTFEEKKEPSLSYKKLRYQLTGPVVASNKLDLPPCSSLRMFSSVESYTSNLERKYRSGRMGVITEILQGLHVGLAYSNVKNAFREYSGISLGNASSLVKTKADAESFATILSLNPYSSAITINFALCYGWGKLKNTRKVMHTNVSVETKGSPAITLTGGLTQLNYVIPISSRVSVSPYVEGVFSKVCWNSYKEKLGLLPCKISKNKESLLECSVGIRNHWELTKDVQIQTWIANIFGHCDLTNMSLQPIPTPLAHHYISIPSNKARYSKFELGFIYDLKCMDGLFVSLQGRKQISKEKKQSNQHISLSFQYIY